MVGIHVVPVEVGGKGKQLLGSGFELLGALRVLEFVLEELEGLDGGSQVDTDSGAQGSKHERGGLLGSSLNVGREEGNDLSGCGYAGDIIRYLQPQKAGNKKEKLPATT